MGLCQLHAVDFDVLEGRDVIGVGRLLQAVHHLVDSGSLPGPRYPGDVHAPGRKGGREGEVCTSCLTS